MKPRKKICFRSLPVDKQVLLKTGGREFILSRLGDSYYRLVADRVSGQRVALNRSAGGEPFPVVRFTSRINKHRAPETVGMWLPVRSDKCIEVDRKMHFQLLEVDIDSSYLEDDEDGELEEVKRVFHLKNQDNKTRDYTEFANLVLVSLDASPFFYNRKPVSAIMVEEEEIASEPEEKGDNRKRKPKRQKNTNRKYASRRRGS